MGAALPVAEASVKDFPDRPFTFRVFSGQPDLSYNFESLVSEAAPNIKYKPNTGSPTGIGFSYAGLIGFSYTTEINEQKVTEEKGQTSYDDYRFTFAFSNFLIGADYLRYRGFFIENTNEVDPTATEPFIRRRDIRSTTIGGRFIWVFSPKDYSLPNLLDQSARQEKSGGSWMVGANYSQFEVSADSPFVPDNRQAEFGADATLFKGQFDTLSATAGYGYTWVFSQKYYIGLMVLIGTGIQSRSFETDNGKTRDTGRVEKFDARLALGYNGDRFFIGAYSEGDTTKFKTDAVQITSELLNFRIFMGLRF